MYNESWQGYSTICDYVLNVSRLVHKGISDLRRRCQRKLGYTEHLSCPQAFLQSIDASLLLCKDGRSSEIDTFYDARGVYLLICAVVE